MSGPKDDRGDDAFGDFFGDPTPSGSMGPWHADAESTAPIASGSGPEEDDQPTRDISLPERDTSTVERTPPHPASAGAVPEGWWAVDPTPTPASSQTWHAEPTSYPQQHAPTPPPRRGVSPFVLLAMLIGGVLLGGLCVGGVVLALGGDDEPAAAPPTTVTATSTTDPPTSDEAPSTSSSTSSSSSSSPTRSGTLPAGASACAGPVDGTSVGTGSEVTSCAFAGAVREAYLAKEPKGDVDLEVRSPVTNKTYTMSCTGESVTRCTGGNNAIVYLY